MARLPQPGNDSGVWGDILNEFLAQAHNTDGTLKPGSVSANAIGDNAITGSKLADDAVSNAKISATAAIDQGKIAGLTTALADKAPTAHTHAATDINSGTLATARLGSGSATSSTFLRGDSTWATIPAGTTTTKRITLTFGSPNSGLSNGTPTAIGSNTVNSRALNMVQKRPVRYRFKIANASAQNGNNPATPIQVDSIWIGKPAYTDGSHNNKWLGDMTATPQQVYAGPGALATSGTSDLVTGWITNTGEISPYAPFVFSLGITASSGGSGLIMSDIYGGMQYGPSSTTQAGIAVPGSGYNYAGAILDVRMEYEIDAADDDLVALVIGASGESGYSGTGDLSANPRVLNDPVDAWPSVWAAQQGYHVINAGLFGSATTDWLSTSTRPYTRFDLATTVPDIAIIGSMVSNDISLGTSLATLESNYYTLVSNLRSLGIKRVFGITIPPRSLNGSNETTRVNFNQFLRAIPAGLEGVFDIDILLRDAANHSAMSADYASADAVHPLRAGLRAMAGQVRIGI